MADDTTEVKALRTFEGDNVSVEDKNEDTPVKQLDPQTEMIIDYGDENCDRSVTSDDTASDDGSETCVKQNIPFDEYATSCTQTRPLQKGKMYHLFVSFSSKDEPLVRPVVEALEREGLKCMCADRDFTPGKLVLANIETNIQKSMKMLIMMTENFTESGFCQHEFHVYQHVALLENRHHCVIPVMLRPCDVPPGLNMLTYIDADKEPNLIAKIIETYDVEDKAESYIPIQLNFVYTQAIPDSNEDSSESNGFVLLSLSASSTRKDGLGAGLELQKMSDSQKQKLDNADLKEAVGNYEDMRKVLNKLWIMKLHRLLSPGAFCCTTCICLMVMLFGIFSCLLAIVFITSNKGDFSSSTLLSAVTAVVLCAIMTIFWKIASIKAQRIFLSTIWKTGRKSFLERKYFITLKNRSSMILDFVRYDAEPCQDYIQKKIESDSQRLSQDEIERRAEDMLVKCIEKNLYSQESPWTVIPQSCHRRHTKPEFLNRCCLCQLVVIHAESPFSAGNSTTLTV